MCCSRERGTLRGGESVEVLQASSFQLPAARFWGGRRGEVKVSRTSTPSTEGPGAAVSVDSVSRSSQSENPDPEFCVHMVSLVVRYVPVMMCATVLDCSVHHSVLTFI